MIKLIDWLEKLVNKHTDNHTPNYLKGKNNGGRRKTLFTKR
jgi:hypothetical protein